MEITRERIEELGFTFVTQTETDISIFRFFRLNKEEDVILQWSYGKETKRSTICLDEGENGKRGEDVINRKGKYYEWIIRNTVYNINELHFIISRSRLGHKIKSANFEINIIR